MSNDDRVLHGNPAAVAAGTSFMRFALVLVFVGAASADSTPKPEAKARTVPHVKGMSEAQRGVELTPSIEYQNDVTKAPAFGGGTDAVGMVQRPAWMNDMRDYADGGMVIRPSRTGDDMVIAPGTSWLSSGTPLRRFWNTLQYGADRFWESLSPSAGGT